MGQSRLIRESTNKGWVLGNERFKDMYEERLSRKLAALDTGGDRRSKAFVENRIK